MSVSASAIKAPPKRGGLFKRSARAIGRGIWWLLTAYFVFAWQQVKQSTRWSSAVMQSVVWLLIVPMVVVVFFGSIFVGFDQLLKPDFTVNQRFVEVDSTPNDGEVATDRDVGVALLTAAFYQMDRELNENPFLGWTANDKAGLQLWDNRVNRQLGVRHAANILYRELTWITNYGDSDMIDPRILSAAESGIGFDPLGWNFPGIAAAESHYRSAIKNLNSFLDDVRNDRPNVVINITNEDKRDIVEAADKALSVAHGRLVENASNTPWTKIDDDLFFAKGAALVVRDVLVAFKHGFAAEMQRRGTTDNLNQAIRALESAINIHPWPWTMLGMGDSAPFADHRAKQSQYFQDARRRIENVVDALKG